jgi:hypothetical protein
VNLGEITQVQKQVQQRILAQMQAKKEVATSLQQPQMDN